MDAQFPEVDKFLTQLWNFPPKYKQSSAALLPSHLRVLKDSISDITATSGARWVVGFTQVEYGTEELFARKQQQKKHYWTENPTTHKY